MTTKKYAIPEKIADIALKYGYNVSNGIRQMRKKIEELEKEIEQIIEERS